MYLTLKNKVNSILNNKVVLILLNLIFSFIFVENCTVSFLKNEMIRKDSSVFRYVGYAMSKGQIPYKDTFDHKGPLLYLINYLGLSISPRFGLCIIEFITFFVTIFIIYKISNKICKNPVLSTASTFISACMAFGYLQGGNLTEEYAMPLIAIAIYIFMDYFLEDNISSLRLVICGLCGGGVLMLRPNMAIAWFAFPLFVLIKMIKEKNIKDLVKYLSWFLLGVVCAVAPFIIYFGVNGALGDFFNVYIGFNMEYTASKAGFKALFESIYTFVSPLLIVSFVIISALIVSQKKQLFNYAYLLFTLLTIVSILMPGRAYGHYGMILIPVFAYPVSMFLSKVKKDVFCNKIVISLLTIGILLSCSISMFMCARNMFLKPRVDESNTMNTVDFIKENTNDTDKILVLGSNDYIYLKAERLSSTKYSYQSPVASISEKVYNEFFDEIKKDPPKAIIIPEDYKYLDGMEDYLKNYGYDEAFKNEEFSVLQQH